MTELTNGMVEATKRIMTCGSLPLAIIFFIGHVIIAMIVVTAITGASIWEAGLVALVEPAVNSVWFYILHKLWSRFNEIK